MEGYGGLWRVMEGYNSTLAGFQNPASVWLGRIMRILGIIGFIGIIGFSRDTLFNSVCNSGNSVVK
jgi:hypothetical protein